MPTLLDPLTVVGLRFKNRIVVPPMATGKSTEKGEVTPSLIQHYSRRASGPGLIIIEHAYVAKKGRLSPRQLGVYEDSLTPGLSKLTRVVKQHGALAALQITHAGGATSSLISGEKPVAPSPVQHPRGKETPRRLNKQKIQDLVKSFGQAAQRAKRAGFDAVEIHGAHGFLLNQFVSPITNKRSDEYGGSLGNKARFPLEVIKEVRVKVGSDYPILYRLGADDRMPGGATIEDNRKIAAMLVSAGVDILDISGGMCGSGPEDLQGEGYFIPLAEKIKEVLEVPVIGVGGIRTPSFADQVIREGRVDLVAVGRAQLADPEWAMKAILTLKNQSHQR